MVYFSFLDWARCARFLQVASQNRRRRDFVCGKGRWHQSQNRADRSLALR
ncbi:MULTISPECIES: hypothetical protein [unclassified Leucobacter]